MRVYKAILLLGLSLLLTSCFHLRTDQDFPAALKNLSLTTDNVYSEITADLTRRLTGSGVALNATPAPTLKILLRNSRTNTDIPIIFDSLQGTVYSYQISVTLILTTKMGKIIFNNRLEANQQIMHNVNQISPPVLTPLMRRALTQKLVDSIYNTLISTNVQQAATNPQRKDT